MVVVALPIQVLDLVIITSTTDTYQVGSGALLDRRESATGTTYSDESVYIGGQVAIQAAGPDRLHAGHRRLLPRHRRHLPRRRAPTRASRCASRRGARARRSGSSVLLVLGLVAAFIALIVPGIWLTVAWSVAIPVMLVEDVGGTKALGRSFALVKDRWWATFGRLRGGLHPGLGRHARVIGGDHRAGGRASSTTRRSARWCSSTLANFLVSLLTTPFVAALTTLVYFDLRVRKERFDPARWPAAPTAHPRPRTVASVGAGAGSAMRSATRPPAPASAPGAERRAAVTVAAARPGPGAALRRPQRPRSWPCSSSSTSGQQLTFSFADLMRYHGPDSPGGVAHAYKVLEAALPLLGPGGPCERRAMTVRTAFGGPGARDGFELVTRAVTEGRYVVDAALARPGARARPRAVRLRARPRVARRRRSSCATATSATSSSTSPASRSARPMRRHGSPRSSGTWPRG